MPLRLVGERGDKAYESRIYFDGEMHVRPGLWHDLFNLLAWLAYPETKAALNERHCAPGENDGAAADPPRAARSRARDTLTLFDENGAICAASDAALLGRVRDFEWKALFWGDRRRVVECMHVFTLGHALAEKALAPFVGMSAHAMLLEVAADFARLPPARQVGDVDRLAAQVVRGDGSFATPQALAPLPVLGIPGWWADNTQEAFYENTAYFRPGRARRD